MFPIVNSNYLIFRLRDNIEELRRSLEPKETALETLQHSIREKEQVVEHLVLFVT